MLGLSLSQEGLLAGWNILAKGTLGVVASILLAATTDARSLLLALQRLRVPPVLVEITSFMVRYADVITDEMRRMKIARESRGFVGGSRKQLGVVAASAGPCCARSTGSSIPGSPPRPCATGWARCSPRPIMS